MTAWHVFKDRPVAVATSSLPEAATEGLQGCQRATVQGQPVTIVPHDYRSWHLMRQRGLLVPAPTCRFDWPGPKNPMAHQKATTDFFIYYEKCFCLNGLRTGKTLSALWAAEYLKQQHIIKRVLVVAPKIILDLVWERELFMSLPHRRRAILRGSRKRKQQMAEDERIDFILVNPESLHLVHKHLRNVDLIIVDEFTTFKSMFVGGQKSQRYSALQQASRDRMLWLMSATPYPQYPSDAYGPIRLVNPKYITLTAFRDLTEMKVSEHKRVPRFGAQKIIAEWMQPAIRFKREDCIDIPDEDTGDLTCSLSVQQANVIESLRDTLSASVGSGNTITAAHQAAVMSKALQVMAGGVYGDDPTGERATHSVKAEPYLETIEAVVREDDGPTLVFVNFQCSVDVAADHLRSKGLAVGTLTRGRATMNGVPCSTMQLFDAFHKHGTLDAIVAVPQTMKYGLELTRCHTVLWASPTFSYETYDQANARVKGATQQRKVQIIHLIQNALSRELFHRLKAREEFQNEGLELFELLTTE